MRFSILIVLMFLFACDRQEVNRLKTEVQTLKKQNELIRRQTELKNHFVREYTLTLNTVYDHLEKIRKREGMIWEYSKSMEKGRGTLRHEMMRDINAINAYIRAGKNKLTALKKRLKKAGMDSRIYMDTIEKLTRRLEEKERYIAELKAQNARLSRQVAEARDSVEHRDSIIVRQNERLNTAYYIIATEKELSARHIVEYRGGLLGIGQTAVLSGALNDSLFTPARIDTLTRLRIRGNVEDIEIVSGHAPDSYELMARGDSSAVLEIRDPAAFWRMRYLVIQTGG